MRALTRTGPSIVRRLVTAVMAVAIVLQTLKWAHLPVLGDDLSSSW